ncbi:hypothetical protein [Devosia sp.]|uniref:hypothetical protein n=1 Tax=Devosia sp. TaxID=1871048 RepID=UPI0032632B9D
MVLQVVGLWIVVGLIMVWFVRDEQQRRDLAARQLAASTRQPYRYKAPVEKVAVTPPTPVRRPVLTDAERNFIAMLNNPQA